MEKCFNNCDQILPIGNYSYWENNSETTDEKEIYNYLRKNKIKNKKILHVGIGNSHIATKFSNNNYIVGITIAKEEFYFAKKLKLNNYKIYMINKYSKKLKILSKNKFDIIIDANLKSYACCQNAFKTMFSFFAIILKKNGFIISNKRGMSWSSKLIPKFSFKLKSFGKKILKETKGSKNNILTINECRLLAQQNYLTINQEKNLVKFTKK